MRFRHEQTPNNQTMIHFPEEGFENKTSETMTFEEKRDEIKKQYGILTDEGFEEKEDGWYWKGIRVDKLDELDDTSNIPYHRGQA